MRTRHVFLTAFALLVFAIAARAFVLAAAFDRTLARYDDLAAGDERAALLVWRASAIAIDLETGIRGLEVTGDRAFLEPYGHATQERAGVVAELKKVPGADAAWVDLGDRLGRQLDEWDAEIAAPVLASGGDGPDRVGRARRGKEQMDAIRATLDSLRGAVAARRAMRASSLGEYRDGLRREVIASAAGICFVLLVLLAILVRTVERPLATLVEHAERAATGDLAPIALRVGASELRELAAAFSRMTHALAEDRAREKRFVDLVSALAAGGDVKTLADIALRALMAEHGATGGVVWIAKDDDAPLTLATSTVLDPGALPEGGDALAREVRASGSPVFVSGLAKKPKHVVRSALVDVVPAALLVVPVRPAKRVVGVVELAGEIGEPRWPDVERALARVGLALENAIAAERTAALRARVTSANEELQAQNEELKAQEEELRAQGEELIRQRAELAQRNDELVRASQHKSDFVASMSHELRTPLNAVIGFAEVLLAGTHGALTAPQRDAMADVLAAGRQLLSLVNDILDLAKVEAGQLDIHVAELDVDAVAREACGLLALLAQRRGVTLENRVEPTGAVGDPDRVRQVLVNLLSNAIKFSPAGASVVVSAKREGDLVRVAVTDRGPGIAPADAARLFQPFSQLDAARAHGGTGLGLVISKRLVDAMGGEIGFTSERDRGTTFYFTLPGRGGARVTSMRSPSIVASAPAVARARVLVVEDDPTSARVTESVLAPAGYKVAIEPNAERALVRLDGDEEPALLVVDLALPGMSGFALIDRVRANASLARLPIVVLTARDLSEEERAGLAPKVDLVAQKGMMTAAGFLDSVASIVARGHAGAPVRVLVVDDNEVNRRVVRGFLGSAGYEVIEADDAEGALAIAHERAPQVVLMDVRMPGMDGLEATRRLAADPATRACRVIALSAQAMVGDRERALDAGCLAYLAKPVGRQELVEAVRAALATS